MSGGEFEVRAWLVGVSYLVAATLLLMLVLERIAQRLTPGAK